eukprot:6866906-Pyramimonas_sp.AAC.1
MRRASLNAAAGGDGLRGALSKVAPEEMTRIFLPLLFKVALTGKEPLGFKDGRVAWFYKGAKEVYLAKNQRNILKANTLGKLYHRFIRSRALGLLQSALLLEQQGGFPGRSCETSSHMVRLHLAAAEIVKAGSSAIFFDLSNAFYSVIRQFALSLPRDQDDMAHVLQECDLPEVLGNAVLLQLEHE